MVSLLFSLLLGQSQGGAGSALLPAEFSFVEELEGQYSVPGTEVTGAKLSLSVDCFFFRQPLSVVKARMERDLRQGGWSRAELRDGSVRYEQEGRRIWLHERELMFGSRPKEYLCFLVIERPERPFTFVPRLTEEEIERLPEERNQFIQKLYDAFREGGMSGEGYANYYMFPVGASDRMYHLTGVSGYRTRINDEPWETVPRNQNLTLYVRVNGEVELVWSVHLEEDGSRLDREGSLAAFVRTRRQRPVDVSKAVAEDLGKRMALAFYYHGHGDSPMYSWLVNFHGTLKEEYDFDGSQSDYDLRVSKSERRLLERGF